MTTPTFSAFLIHPAKGNDSAPEIVGNLVPGSGKLFDMLSAIFHAKPDGRDFEVTFDPNDDGSQQNDCRDLFLAATSSPGLATATPIAKRLQLVTDNRSGIGLLFVMVGQHGTKNRIVVSRFPANEAILAEVDESGLDVAYLERVFIKKTSSYKAVIFSDEDPQSGFWKGSATDRQAGGEAENISSYWLHDFLNADFAETPKAATKRLAEALKKAMRANPSIDVKSEIAASISLAPAVFAHKTISAEQYCDHFGFSKNTKDSIIVQMAKPGLFEKVFQFDRGEFIKKVAVRIVEMDSGAMLSAPSDQFAKVFEVKQVSDGVF
ncbi:MAG: hypothetical protein RL339_501 [Pseudomonadota bacterium]|jgi:hypothetical protein